MGKEFIFNDRRHAGQALATHLTQFKNQPDTIVLGLPRGGIPVAFEVSRALNQPLDVLVVRKLGVPGHEEFAMGAIASGGAQYLDRKTIHDLDISDDAVSQVLQRETRELQRREERFHTKTRQIDLRNKNVIIVDDGLATGSTVKAAIEAIKTQSPRKVIVAVPVAPSDTAREITALVDEFICLSIPSFFNAVGESYQDFSQTSDDDVVALLSAN